MKKVPFFMFVLFGLALSAIPSHAQSTDYTTNDVAGFSFSPYSASTVYIASNPDGSTSQTHIIVDNLTAGRTYLEVMLPGETQYTFDYNAPSPTATTQVVGGFTFYYVTIPTVTLTTSSGKTFTLLSATWVSERKAGWRGGWTYVMQGGTFIFTVD
jgi:hypothetical protein